MTQEEKLREKIAKLCNNARCEDGALIAWDNLAEYEKGIAYNQADRIVALIKEAGWKPPPIKHLTIPSGIPYEPNTETYSTKCNKDKQQEVKFNIADDGEPEPQSIFQQKLPIAQRGDNDTTK